jgi:hypothetical protein
MRRSIAETAPRRPHCPDPVAGCAAGGQLTAAPTATRLTAAPTAAAHSRRRRPPRRSSRSPVAGQASLLTQEDHDRRRGRHALPGGTFRFTVTTDDARVSAARRHSGAWTWGNGRQRRERQWELPPENDGGAQEGKARVYLDPGTSSPSGTDGGYARLGACAVRQGHGRPGQVFPGDPARQPCRRSRPTSRAERLASAAPTLSPLPTATPMGRCRDRRNARLHPVVLARHQRSRRRHGYRDGTFTGIDGANDPQPASPDGITLMMDVWGTPARAALSKAIIQRRGSSPVKPPTP